MQQKGIIQIQIPNLRQVMSAFSRAPETAAEEYQRVVNLVPDILAKYTLPVYKGGTVPYRTGALVQTFQRNVGKLTARWFPTREYAPFVELGTRRMKARPFMEGILRASTQEIDDAFERANDRVVQRIASQSQ